MSYHQTIYNLLRGYGLSEAGALGMLGNWECESGCEPCRVQGDYQASRVISKAYVNAIDSGFSDRERFSYDQKGFGLAQWTYPDRKANLWCFWLQTGGSIADCKMQVDFAMYELKTQYSGLLSFLKTAEDIRECARHICCEYERPDVNNVQTRYEAALRIRAEIDLSGKTEPEPQEKPEEPRLETWPPRTIDEHCSGWAEVWLLQALLKCHGYNVLVDGIFGESLTHKVKQFQSENGLDPDGAVGNMSWSKLMERR